MKTKFAFIGAGNIVSAILTGVEKSGQYKNCDIGIYDINQEILSKYKNKEYTIYLNIKELSNNTDIVIFALTPQIFKENINSISKDINQENTIISLAAGITLAYLQEHLNSNKIFRCMPTLAASERLGSFALSLTDEAKSKQEKVNEFFSSCGVCEYISEELMSKVVAINGSAPGYFYYIARIVEEVGIEFGFDKEITRRLFAQTMKGSAQTILKSPLSLEELEGKIKVHKGTTEAALIKMEEMGLENCIKEGLRACVKRNEELGKVN